MRRQPTTPICQVLLTLCVCLVSCSHSAQSDTVLAALRTGEIHKGQSGQELLRLHQPRLVRWDGDETQYWFARGDDRSLVIIARRGLLHHTFWVQRKVVSQPCVTLKLTRYHEGPRLPTIGPPAPPKPKKLPIQRRYHGLIRSGTHWRNRLLGDTVIIRSKKEYERFVTQIPWRIAPPLTHRGPRFAPLSTHPAVDFSRFSLVAVVQWLSLSVGPRIKAVTLQDDEDWLEVTYDYLVGSPLPSPQQIGRYDAVVVPRLPTWRFNVASYLSAIEPTRVD